MTDHIVTPEQKVVLPDTSVSQLVKQQDNNGDKKPTGFQLHPENINRKGRPPKGWAWADIFEDLMETTPDNSTKTFKTLVAMALLRECINGNVSAIRELFDRMEGRPKQKVDVTSAEKKLALTTGEGKEAVLGLARGIIKRYEQQSDKGLT